MPRCVRLRAERDAGLADLAQGGQRHDLEPARIGEDRMRPVHEAMQPAQCRDAFGSDRNATPASLILRKAASDMTWNPPESVRIVCGQFMKRCSPPNAAMRSAQIGTRRRPR